MAIALGTALAISAAASAAGSGIKAKMQSNAAKKASEQQVQGTGEASRYMQQGLQNLNQLYSPYVNAGAGAMGTLGRLTTPGAGARYASAGPPNAMPPAPGGQAVPRPGRAMPPGARRGRCAGPYHMAEGGDMVVDEPTMFVAGEAGPERATFSGGGGEMGQMQMAGPPEPMPEQGPGGGGGGGWAPMAQGLAGTFGGGLKPAPQDLQTYRNAGAAAGQDMSWMNRPGAISPQYGGGGMSNLAAGVAGAFGRPRASSDDIRSMLMSKCGGGGGPRPGMPPGPPPGMPPRGPMGPGPMGPGPMGPMRPPGTGYMGPMAQGAAAAAAQMGGMFGGMRRPPAGGGFAGGYGGGFRGPFGGMIAPQGGPPQGPPVMKQCGGGRFNQ